MRSRNQFPQTLLLVLLLAGCGSTQAVDADDTIDLIVNGDYVVTMDEDLAVIELQWATGILIATRTR